MTDWQPISTSRFDAANAVEFYRNQQRKINQREYDKAMADLAPYRLAVIPPRYTIADNTAGGPPITIGYGCKNIRVISTPDRIYVERIYDTIADSDGDDGA